MLASVFVLPSFKSAERKRRVGKEAMAGQISASATAMKPKRQKSDNGTHQISLSANHSSLIQYD